MYLAGSNLAPKKRHTPLTTPSLTHGAKRKVYDNGTIKAFYALGNYEFPFLRTRKEGEAARSKDRAHRAGLHSFVRVKNTPLLYTSLMYK